MKKLVAVLTLMISAISCNLFASNAWYNGVVERVALLRADGSFIVTFENDKLDDCSHQYVYFEVSNLGLD